MSHGHSIGASIRFPSVERANRPSHGDLAWRRLDPERRLELVARALGRSDGVINVFPLAL